MITQNNVFHNIFNFLSYQRMVEKLLSPVVTSRQISWAHVHMEGAIATLLKVFTRKMASWHLNAKAGTIIKLKIVKVTPCRWETPSRSPQMEHTF